MMMNVVRVMVWSVSVWAAAASAFNFDTAPGALPKTLKPLESIVHLELDPYAPTFKGEVTHRVNVRRATDKIVVLSADLSITSARVKGIDTPLAPILDEAAQTLTLHLPRTLPVGEAEFTFIFEGKNKENSDGMYVRKYKLADGSAKQLLLTDMEPIGTRYLVPSFDEPSFRVPWSVSVTAPKKFTVVSNMPIAQAVPQPDERVRTQFLTSPSMPSYLLALAVGEFEKAEDSFEGISLGIYTVEGRKGETAYAMDATKRVLAFMHQYFGSRYQLPKLDQIAIPGKAGAMENWGMITYADNLLLVPQRGSAETKFWSTNVIAHEISHQWFGNWVTMAWWDDLWLNESFAEWMAHKTVDALHPEWNARLRLSNAKEEAMIDDSLANARPIQRVIERDRAAMDSFDNITYQKGHAVLSMLETYVGEKSWREGLRAHLARNAMGNASGADFWAALSKVSGKDVAGYARAWITQPGFPQISVTTSCEKGERIATLSQKRYQLQPDYVPKQAWQTALTVRPIGVAGGATMPLRSVTVATKPERVRLGPCARVAAAVVGALSYTRVKYDPSTLAALEQNVAQLQSAEIIALINDSWALAEVGELPPGAALGILRQLNPESPADVWISALDAFQRMRVLLRGTPQEPDINQWVQTAVKPLMKKLTLRPAENDTAAVHRVRKAAFIALAQAGDEETLRGARGQLNAALNLSNNMDANVREALINAVGIVATPGDVDRLVAFVQSPESTPLQWTVLKAMTSAQSPETARYVLSLSIADKLPRDLAQRLIGAVASNGGHNELAWKFTQDNLPALFARQSTWGRRYTFAAPLNGARDTTLAEFVRAKAEAELEADARVETYKQIASVQRNAWAAETVQRNWKMN
jgi:aminopeptidase N